MNGQSRDELQQSFVAITGVNDSSRVREFLNNNNWNLETSLNKFYDNPDVIRIVETAKSTKSYVSQQGGLNRAKRYGTSKSYTSDNTTSQYQSSSSYLSHVPESGIGHHIDLFKNLAYHQICPKIFPVRINRFSKFPVKNSSFFKPVEIFSKRVLYTCMPSLINYFFLCFFCVGGTIVIILYLTYTREKERETDQLLHGVVNNQFNKNRIRFRKYRLIFVNIFIKNRSDRITILEIKTWPARRYTKTN